METARATEASFSSSTSSIATPLKYDVFLSFRGVDTRNSFTSHLLDALERHGFDTFIDDKNLKRGEYINDELLKAIERSRISLVVLSKNYAASKWCLNELVKIMECRENLQQVVFPVFHGVEPSEVRAQKGSLAEAFAKHAKHFGEGPGSKVGEWKEALTHVANLSGWDLPKEDNGNEAKLIQKIIKVVRNTLNIAHPSAADHQVGLKSRLEKLNLSLSMESTSEVRIVGICGIGGIGKTTIAMEQYYSIQHMFEGRSFLANVGDAWKQQNGLVDLQEKLLLDICGSGTHKLRNRYEGVEDIKRRAFCRKVLVVLDDVDDVQQFKALAINRDFFLPGSRILVTTRNVSLLKSLEVDEIYFPAALDRRESLELLSWHAFKEDHPRDDYLDLSHQVVGYAEGLPLALEILGSYLHDKSRREWSSAISKLETYPDDKIQGKLMVSLDSLGEKEKELFVDIACFFVGADRDSLVKILEGCQKFAENGIRDLANLCLVKYQRGKIVMHQILRDMGRKIARQKFEEPGRWSRLWNHKDALEVLEDGTGTKVVQGLVLNFDELNEIDANPKAFEKMNRLWLLHLNYVHLREGYEHISRRLMWLCWNGFPMKCLPSNLCVENLVTLDLRYSSLENVWTGTKILVKLKFLYLSHCYNLIGTPDFHGLNNLEELLLNDCKSLVVVDESILSLNKLTILDMKNCTNLRIFPFRILMMKSIESVDLTGCAMLKILSGFKGSPSKSMFSSLTSWIFRTKRVESIGLSPPNVLGSSCLKELRMRGCNLSSLPNEVVGNLISLETLDLSENNLRILPDHICNLTRLKKLMVTNCNLSCLPNEVGSLMSLEKLDLSRNNLCSFPDHIWNLTGLKDLGLAKCNVSHLPGQIGRLILLEDLDLAGNNLLTLPDSLCNLSRLAKLNLAACKLSHLPDQIGMLSSLLYLCLDRNNNLCRLPNTFSDLASLRTLYMQDCASIQSLPQHPANLQNLIADGCTSLESIPTEFNWQAGLRMWLDGCNILAKNNFANNVMKTINFREPYAFNYAGFSIYLPGDEVPNWFQYQSTGSKLFVVVPRTTRRIRGWCFCAVFRINRRDCCPKLPILCHNPTPWTQKLHVRHHHHGEDQIYIRHIKSQFGELHGGYPVEIAINPKDLPDFTVKKCGINFIYEGDEDDSEMPLIEIKGRKTTERTHFSKFWYWFIICVFLFLMSSCQNMFSRLFIFACFMYLYLRCQKNS